MWKIRHARYTNTSSVAEKLLYYLILDRRAQCLSPIQVAPGYVNEILTMGTERVKPENYCFDSKICLSRSVFLHIKFHTFSYGKK